MLKGVARTPEGRTLLMLGLSFDNLAEFKAHPRDTFIRVDGAEIGLPIDVLIFSGESEEAIAQQLGIFPNFQPKGTA